jgi:hypothetical protein
MQGSMRLQEWIHRLEVGGGARWVRWIAVIVGFIALAAIYNGLCFRNMTNPAAMDAAQVGRNLAEGRGYDTFNIRSLGIWLLQEHRADKSALLKDGHPDLANPPVYPLLLSGLLRLTPEPGNLANEGAFSTYGPDLWIALLNQALLGLGALLVFRLALLWFNQPVAWMSVVLFLLTELYWRFSISGLSTILLIDLVLLLAWFLSRLEQRQRENSGGVLFTAFVVGLIVGVAMLTRYSAGWLIVPALAFVAFVTPGRRASATVLAFAGFLLVAAPWIARNVIVSGVPLGTSTFAVLEATPAFPGDTLQRSLSPVFTGLPGSTWRLFVMVMHKGATGLRDIVGTDLPRLGGNWLWAFFLAGLLVKFQNPTLNRARGFVVGAMVILAVAQAFGRTFVSGEWPVVNADNLLVILSPLVLIFGVGIFFVLFESWQVPSVAARWGAYATFVVIVSLPLWFALLPPRSGSVTAPYYPPRIQQLARYAGEGELLMSDIPWAVAWYGERPCLWLTLNWRKDLVEIHDYHRPLAGLYVSTRTTDSKFLSNWFGSENQGWCAFLLESFVKREIPQGFPLKHSPEGLFLNGEVLLMDRDRWSEKSAQ